MIGFGGHDIDLCFYCDQPIGNDERVIGDKADAHRRCVHDKLDRLKPDWRKEINPGEPS